MTNEWPLWRKGHPFVTDYPPAGAAQVSQTTVHIAGPEYAS